MVKLYLDPGHGGSDPGAIGNGLKEKNLTLAISLKIRDLLKQYDGVQVRLSRTTDKSLTLKQRTDDANAWGADYLLSIHINAFNGSARGYEDYIYSGLSDSSQTAQYRNVMHEEITKAINLPNRGRKKANFHMLRESRMSAMLSENGFIDNAQDAALLKQDSFLDSIAEGHVNGLVRIFSLKKTINGSSEKTKPSRTAFKNKLVIDGKWGEKTTRALQEYLGTVVDGKISDQVRNPITNAFYGNTIVFGSGKKGSLVIKALQQLIGAKVDGLLGPETIGKLQKYLGTTHDKVLSRPSEVVKELQRRLNKGNL
ncbi:N-acetylmuramoyl-L-alanine amidase family protein [Piscibacillus sp. B03]|uniref:N-acetylmuramoyl-L-alanine amidase family protein n=1 Tax=Piscibacillus sp. B03 TaxID=3457430 RepID=UPI003FCC579D